jgi:Flp pilus assembly protein TadD
LWEEAYSAAANALKIIDKAAVYTMDPTVWGALPHDLLAVAAHRLGLKEVAVRHGELAVQLSPDDPRLTKNLEYYKN